MPTDHTPVALASVARPACWKSPKEDLALGVAGADLPRGVTGVARTTLTVSREGVGAADRLGDSPPKGVARGLCALVSCRSPELLAETGVRDGDEGPLLRASTSIGAGAGRPFDFGVSGGRGPETPAKGPKK
jgi:hypothetical protein